MQQQVLTTAEAAKLLGVSVRTAQLLIENGPLKSWKTPGGHRRVYLQDVLAYMTQTPRSPEFASALAILVTSPERKPLFDARLGSVSECLVESWPDVHIAAYAIGARLPAAVIVDMHDARDERREFLRQLTAHPELGTTRFIAVADSSDPTDRQGGRPLVATLDEVADAVRAVFVPAAGPPDVPLAPSSSLSFPIASNERERLSALQRSGLLSTPAEPAFDRLTWLASEHLHMPVSLMTLLSATHQHFKSRVGLDLTETPRDWAMCNQTILQKHVYSVPDLSTSNLFSTNPAVAGPPHFRFYAGAPVFDPDGFALGSICVMDYEPHRLEAAQEQTLLALAAIASDEVRIRANKRPARPNR
ncbi:excisionase family DNA-binding protein [Steroidobacter sp. S1-65]|uniref:Excisionase family DNA-binding protein n=1 Tax=Steroidobacter gossypii TaxID=2805490 RepID=A0ABS1X5P3_9GAMM|nr:excisionase family DNA-binding protein [Steroidobacter gossypii]MBM0108551.1 excisionase family DNA-binding protein [Steroidobacter gossypii]